LSAVPPVVAVLLPIRERTLAGYHNAPFRVVMLSCSSLSYRAQRGAGQV